MKTGWPAAAVAACLLVPAYAAHTQSPEPELLEPDRAFALSTRVLDTNTLEARWKIADGYYMYRDNFRFEALDNAVVLETPVLPAGKLKDDPLFGTVEIYTEEVAVQLPIVRRPQGAAVARVRITAQGCNLPVGVCYPPITKEVSYALPALPATTGAGAQRLRPPRAHAEAGSPTDALPGARDRAPMGPLALIRAAEMAARGIASILLVNFANLR